MGASVTAIPCGRPRQADRSVAQHDCLEKLSSLATTLRCCRGQEICGEERAADYWYRLVSGMARRYALRSSGRRQILGLLLPGDFFGFFPARDLAVTVEAMVDGTIVARYPRRQLEALADSDPPIAREIRETSFATIARLHEQVLILGRTTALKKLGSFLLRMADLLPDRSSGVIVLPMSRYDVADYLGLSVETVSRGLTELKTRGVIRLLGTRQIRIIDRAALEDGVEGRARAI